MQHSATPRILAKLLCAFAFCPCRAAQSHPFGWLIWVVNLLVALVVVLNPQTLGNFPRAASFHLPFSPAQAENFTQFSVTASTANPRSSAAFRMSSSVLAPPDHCHIHCNTPSDNSHTCFAYWTMPDTPASKPCTCHSCSNN